MKIAENPEALISLINRITPGFEDHFEIKFIPYWEKSPPKQSYFEIENKWNNKVLLSAHRLRDLIAAYGWYLKHIAQVHLSRLGDRIDLSGSLSQSKNKVIKRSPWLYRYAYNYCALSYTLPFNDWQDWERELDFLAINGFTHILVTAGLEKVWQQVLLEGGYPEKKTTEYLANPVYAAWWNMGNLEGFGGPLTQGLIDREAELGAKIVRRIRELDMIPVLQGFTGLMPHDLDEYVPELTLVPQGNWVGGFLRPALLYPPSPEFEEWASRWYRHLHQIYDGRTLAYSGDLFHEGGNYAEMDLADVAGSVQQAMQKASPGSKWFIQSWRDNPLPELVRGLDEEQAVILELWKDMSEIQMQSSTLRTYQDKPWLWCEVTNFGGNHDLYGGLSLLTELPSWLLYHQDRENASGLGMLSEGLDTNPIQYDLFFDLFWEKENLDIEQWLDQYVRRRYGTLDANIREAMHLLERSVYNAQNVQEGSTESILCARPSLAVTKVTTWASDRMYYHPYHVISAAEYFLKAAPTLELLDTYRYDLLDIVRQMMADMARPVLAEIAEAFKTKNKAIFTENVQLFLGILDDTNKLLATDQHWLLGKWLEAARKKGKSNAEKELMETMARRLVTTWSGKPDLLDEYSNRQWAGLMADYYKPRWEAFFKACSEAFESENTDSELLNWYADHWQKIDLSFEKQRKQYAVTSKGDTTIIAKELFEKYASTACILWEKHQDMVSLEQ